MTNSKEYEIAKKQVKVKKILQIFAQKLVRIGFVRVRKAARKNGMDLYRITIKF